jgi:PEP-CTERM motif-containing protein
MRFRFLTVLALGLLGAQSANAVIIDGKDWRQLTETTGFSWLNVNEACGGGTCSGSIGTTSVDGWYWADNTDVQGLFDSLIQPGSTQFPTSTTSYTAVNDADIANAVTSIFEATSIFNLGGNAWREVRGLTRSSANGTTTLAYLSDNPFATGLDYAAFDTTYPTNLGDVGSGIWLYKPATPAPVPTPEPATLALFGVAALGLFFVRRERQRSV